MFNAGRARPRVGNPCKVYKSRVKRVPGDGSVVSAYTCRGASLGRSIAMFRRIVGGAVSTGIVVAAVAAAGVQTAGAGASTPDASIAEARNGPYVGKGLFTPPAPIEQQQITQKAPVEATRKYFVNVKEVGGCCGS